MAYEAYANDENYVRNIDTEIEDVNEAKAEIMDNIKNACIRAMTKIKTLIQKTTDALKKYKDRHTSLDDGRNEKYFDNSVVCDNYNHQQGHRIKEKCTENAVANVSIRNSDEYSKCPGDQTTASPEEEREPLNKGEGASLKAKDEGGNNLDYNYLHNHEAELPPGGRTNVSLKEEEEYKN